MTPRGAFISMGIAMLAFGVGYWLDGFWFHGRHIRGGKAKVVSVLASAIGLALIIHGWLRHS